MAAMSVRQLVALFVLLSALVPQVAYADESDVPETWLHVRLTTYLEYGITFGGGHTYPGTAACSWNLNLGDRLLLSDGEVVVCNDRGRLGSLGWVDFWRRGDLPSLLGQVEYGSSGYGYYADVEVL